MKYTALTLLVVGVANAGTIVSSSTSSGSVANNQFGAISTPLLGSGSASQVASKLGSTNGW